ncbi:GGDEF domain-containing protein [Campylobacter sp. CCUG 57310]|uniref:GGDEF domain-containing protein n=1 Tax=Campylobacter sp. CCUG 57310 TaxID=2517362 RepID=UPI00156493F4|nr:GGDEF domain-containing protein [Campylobacter sp. CCUG 57310]
MRRSFIGSDISKKLQIIMIAFMLVHIMYFVIFLYINKPYLSMMNIASVLVYVYLAYILKDSNMIQRVLVVTRFEIFIHAFVCTCVLGWGYGFQNIILALISVAFFTNSIGKILGYVAAFIQGAVYLLLYVLLHDTTEIVSSQAQLIYVFNFLLVVCALVVFSSLLGIFNTMIYLSMLDKQQEFEMAANKDPLTQLPNRRAFINLVQGNAFNSKSSISVAVGDLDDFKRINDKFGHNAGDEVLRKVANIIKTSLRKQDYAFRFGGEEFLLLIINTNLKNSNIILNRIREKIHKHTFKFEQEKLNVSITFGFAYADIDDKFDIDNAIKEADSLLGQGKKSGKNCITGKVLRDIKFKEAQS